MAPIPSPDDVLRTVGRAARTLLRPAGAAATYVARLVLGIDPVVHDELRKVSDDLPKDSLFEQPLEVRVTPRPPEQVPDGTRVPFRVVVRDAVGRRCPDIAVTARVDGPERSASGETTTDLMGAALFRMTGPPGRYAIEVLDVSAGALTWTAPDGPGAEADVTSSESSPDG